MAHPDPQICVVSDETGPQLDDFLAFAHDHEISFVEVRGIDGTNPLSLTTAQRTDAARRIKAAGLTVAGIATPLFKWPPPGQSARDMGDQFGFDRAGRTDARLFEDAIATADAFETRNLRVFSYLASGTFRLDDLKRDYDALLTLADRHDKIIRIENEHVCNIATLSQLAEALEAFDTPRLEGIPDIANSYSTGDHPTEDTIRRVMRHSSHVHIKDYSAARRRFVQLGKGDVPTETCLRQYLAAANGKQLTFSVETHVPENPMSATKASVAELRRLLERISNEPTPA